MVTIIEALGNANYNLDNLAKLKDLSLLPIIKSQLNNAVILLEKGYCVTDCVEELLEKYGSVENVPEKVAA